MTYLIITFIVILILLLIVLFNLIKGTNKQQFQKYKFTEVNVNSVNRDILIKFAEYEKFIYMRGFSGRVLFECTYKEHIVYRAYYYNTLHAVHLYLEIDPNAKENNTSFIFFTRYKSRELITYNNILTDYLGNILPRKIIKNYKGYNIEELYNRHIVNMTGVSNSIIYNRLATRDLLNNRFNLKSYKNSKNKKSKRSSYKSKKKFIHSLTKTY